MQADLLRHRCRGGGVTNALEGGTKSQVVHKWADWLHHPCHMGGPHRFRAGDTIRSGP